MQCLKYLGGLIKNLLLLFIFSFGLAACIASPLIHPNNISTKQSKNLTPEEVTDWGIHAVIAAYHFEPGNYAKALSRASRYFTPHGWLAYQQYLRQSGLAEKLIHYHLALSVQLLEPPILVAYGKEQGHYTWVMRVPVIIASKNHQQIQRQKLHITLQIVQHPSQRVLIECFTVKIYTANKR